MDASNQKNATQAHDSMTQVRAKNKAAFGRASEVLLLLIIYTTFCETFARGMGVAFSQVGDPDTRSRRTSIISFRPKTHVCRVNKTVDADES